MAKQLIQYQQDQLIELLWDSMKRDKEHKDRVQTGWGTKTKIGLISSIERIVDSNNEVIDGEYPEVKDNDSMALIKAEQILNGWAAEEGNFHVYAAETAKNFIKSREILRRFVDLYQGHTERMHSEAVAVNNCTVCSARRLLL